MGIMHGGDAADADPCDSSPGVLGYDGSCHNPFFHVQMVFIAENFHLQWADEVGPSNGEFHQCPVGAIDEIVVVDALPAHHGGQLVVHTANISARVVNI